MKAINHIIIHAGSDKMPVTILEQDKRGRCEVTFVCNAVTIPVAEYTCKDWTKAIAKANKVFEGTSLANSLVRGACMNTFFDLQPRKVS